MNKKLLGFFVILSAVCLILSFSLSQAVEYKEGWPYRVEHSFQRSHIGVTVANLDNNLDNGLEIISGSTAGLVYAWHQDGSSVSGFPVDLSGAPFATLYNISVPAVGNLDNDPELEIVVLNSANISGAYDRVIVLNHDGTDVNGWPQQLPSTTGFSAPVLADLDQDGDLEIIVTYGSFGAYEMTAFHHDGVEVQGFPVGLIESASPAKATIADIDNDGDVEIFVAQKGKLFAFSHEDLDNNGFVDPLGGNWPVNLANLGPAFNGTFAEAPVIGDIRGDGNLEIIIGSDASKVVGSTTMYYIFAFKADGSLVSGWPLTTASPTKRSLIALGYFGDNVLDVVLVQSSGEVLIKTGYGFTPVSGFDNIGSRSVHPFAAAVADIDRDGFSEIAVGGENGLYVFEHDGSIKAGFPLSEKSYTTPVIADIDFDQVNELIVLSTEGVNWHNITPPGGINWDSPLLGGVSVWSIANEGMFSVTTEPSFDASLVSTFISTLDSWPMYSQNNANTGSLVDADGDGIDDTRDNCLEVLNGPDNAPGQLDADADGYGNICDCDVLNNGKCGLYDAWSFAWCVINFNNLESSGQQGCLERADMNGDGALTSADSTIFNGMFPGGPGNPKYKPAISPGPSGVPCAGTIPCLAAP